MPRGNDTHDGLAELANKFGHGVGNAEQLIEANLAMHPMELRKAELLPRNEELTAALDIAKLRGPNGEVVRDACVRQSGVGEPTTVIVYTDEDGRDYLGVLDEKGKALKPDLSAAEAVADRSPAPKQRAEK